MIPGGYYLKARCIQESKIMKAPPHVREIWDLFLMKTRFANGDKLQRGQLLTTYDDIRDSLCWYVGYRKMRYTKWQCEKAMKYLTKENMITTAKTTRGLIITVCNYSYYQDPKNYESHTENHNEATTEPQTTDTIEKNDKKDKKERNKKTLSESNLSLFETFYSAYPVHQGREPAIKAFKKLNLQNGTLEMILDAIKNQKAHKDYLKTTGQFCPEWPLPSTWLSQKRWEDEITLTKGEHNATGTEYPIDIEG